ncbi:MAG: phosphate ABC transporter permease subunit PstC, partial [Candidatus Sulfotelmatobacter sp.]
MANPALPRPDMPGPQPVDSTKVTGAAAAQERTAPLHRRSGGEFGDQVFKFAMLACGLAILGLLILIVYELVLRSGLSWHAFGLKFFATSDWDPVNAQFGALPFIYGTLVSSFLALLIAVPLAVGVA